MNIPTVPTPANPALVDVQFKVIQDSLLAQLIWLNHAFGKVQKLTRKNDSKLITYPGVFVKGQNEDYLSLFPDERLGNFSFFVTSDPYDIEPMANIRQKITVSYGLILWFNMSKILAANEYRNLESIKAQVLQALNNTQMGSGRIETTEIMEESKNIYSEFTIDEIEQQYLMHPFAGLRFDGKLTFYENCI